jgi:hypothetical protein
MTQKEALEQALKDLGGRAHLQDIYPVALKYITHKEGSKIYDSLRGCIHDKRRFRPSPGMPRGWYELLSYQEEFAALKKRVEDLEKQVELLVSIPKEAEFIERFLDEVMDVYKYDRKKADPIRIIMRTLGHEDAVAVLTAWIDEKEDELAKALEKLKIQIRNITMTGNDATYNENNDKDKDE